MELLILRVLQLLFFGALIYIIFIALIPESQQPVMTFLFAFGLSGWVITQIGRYIITILVSSFVTLITLGGISSDVLFITAIMNPFVVIFTPIFGAIISECTRLFSLKSAPNVKTDRTLCPLSFALGWFLGEIIGLFGFGFLFELITPSVGVNLFSFIVFDSVTALSLCFLNVGLSCLVFYSFYEAGVKKFGLYLALVLSFLYMSIFAFFSSFTVLFQLQSVFINPVFIALPFSIFVFFFAFKVWKKRMEPIAIESISSNYT